MGVGIERQEPEVLRQAKEYAKRVDAITGGVQGVRLVAAESGLGKGPNQVEGLGIYAVSEGETMNTRHGTGLGDQPQGERIGFVESDRRSWW